MTIKLANRRQVVQSTLALGIVAGVAPVFIPTTAMAAPATIREGLTIGAQGAIRITLPEVQGKSDLQFSFKEFPDSTAILLALEQQELDFAGTTSQHLVRAVNEGIPVVWVCGWGGGYNVLVARKAFGISATNEEKLRDEVMRRKQAGSIVKVAAPTGSMQHLKLVVYLKGLGIDPDKDLQIVNIPFRNHPRAIEAGEVDMAMTLSVFGAISIVNGDAVVVKHLFDGQFGKQEVGFIAHRNAVSEKRELIQRVVDSHVQAMKLFMGSSSQQIEYEKKYSRLPQPVIEMQERDFLRYDYRTRISDIKRLSSEMQELGWVKGDSTEKIDAYIDLSFLSKATGQPVSELTSW